MSICTNCDHPLDWHSLNPRNDAGVCFGDDENGRAGYCKCKEFGVTIPDTVPTDGGVSPISDTLPDWLADWRCPPCDDDIEGLPCECFDIMAAIERWRVKEQPSDPPPSGLGSSPETTPDGPDSGGLS